MKYNFFCLSVAFLFTVFFTRCHSSQRLSSSLKNIDTTFLGNFTDDYNIRYTITHTSFTQHPGVTYNLLSYNEKEQYFIALNDTANISDGGLYTRIDITRFSNMNPWRWGFCLTAYQAATPEAAVNTAPADRTNPKKGCGGYPFSRMKRY
jgi:hypothetical protein